MAMRDSEEVIRTALIEKIKRQQYLIARLQEELRLAQAASIATVLGDLRLRRAILIYVGNDVVKFEQELRVQFGVDVTQNVLRHLHELDKAPLAHGVREAMRTLCQCQSLW
jgi:hypothetical protein